MRASQMPSAWRNLVDNLQSQHEFDEFSVLKRQLGVEGGLSLMHCRAQLGIILL